MAQAARNRRRRPPRLAGGDETSPSRRRRRPGHVQPARTGPARTPRLSRNGRLMLTNTAKATATPPLETGDVNAVAFRMSTPLHYCTGILACPTPPDCPLCSNAARLVMQAIIPKVADEMLHRIEHLFGRRCELPHP